MYINKKRCKEIERDYRLRERDKERENERGGESLSAQREKRNKG